MVGATIAGVILLGQYQEFQSTPQVSVDLHPSHSQVMPGDRFAVIVDMQISEPWHIYWKNPGDSGIPTDLKWDLPQGWHASEPEFITPSKIDSGGSISYAYEKNLKILTWISVPNQFDSNKTVTINAHLSWLACIEQCVKGDASVSRKVNVGSYSVASPNGIDALNQFKSLSPKPLQGVTVVADSVDGGIRLTVNDDSIDKVYFFSESANDVSTSDTQEITRRSGKVEVFLKKSPFSNGETRKLKGVLTYIDSVGTKKAFNINIPVNKTQNGEEK